LNTNEIARIIMKTTINKTKRVGVRLTEGQRDKVEHVVVKKGLNISKVIGLMIDNYRVRK